MRNLTFAQAINEAMAQEMERDSSVFLMGEDVGQFGGPFGVTRGLVERFGEDRVRDTPISEAGFFGAGVGAALAGMRPIVEVHYADFLTCAMDPIVNQAAKLRLMSGGQASVPMVIRAPVGATNRAAQHSQSLEAWFMHTPGLKVICPSTPYDAKGLFIAAVRDDDPVMCFEHRYLYGSRSPGGKASVTGDVNTMGADVPEEPYLIPFGKADVKRQGTHVTVVATMLMVHKALAAAHNLEGEGISVEVVDPRTLVPLDRETIAESVTKTGRALVVTEDHVTCGTSAELAQAIYELAFEYLRAPVVRVASLDVPMPHAPAGEQFVIPTVEKICAAVRRVLGTSTPCQRGVSAAG